MGYVDYFLCNTFTWLKHKDGNISVHICQSEFTEFTDHWFLVHTANKVSNITPCPSGFPINSITPVDPLDTDLSRQKQVYKSIVGCINWLATCTRPDISPALNFLASYRNAPHPQHYKAAVHALKCITSTNEYGIYFHLQSLSTIHAFNHFSHHHDKEEHTEATDPYPSEFHQLTDLCNSNWGVQFDSAVEDGNPLELFKSRSFSGFLI